LDEGHSQERGDPDAVPLSRMLFRLAIAATVGSLLFSTPTEAQVLPPLKKATRVEIIEGPELESAQDDLAIIRWTMGNPLGSDDHLGVVYYAAGASTRVASTPRPAAPDGSIPSITSRRYTNGLTCQCLQVRCC